MASVDSSSQKRLCDRLAEVTGHTGQNVTIQDFSFRRREKCWHWNHNLIRSHTVPFYHPLQRPQAFWLPEVPPSHSPEDITASSMVFGLNNKF